MFTPEHIEILKKYQHHGETALKLGYIANLDKPVFDDLQQVYNEAINETRFDAWCNGCVFDMVRFLYARLEEQQAQAAPDSQPASTSNLITRNPRRHGRR